MSARHSSQPACPDQMALLSGTLAHLSNYLRTGCPRSMYVARMLLGRMDRQPAFDSELLGLFRTLEQAVTEAHAARHRA